jgi:heme exporter protein C
LTQRPVNESAGNAIASAFIFVLMAFAIYGALIWAPNERTMGFVQRIFYFHASAAMDALLVFFVACIANVLYLLRRAPKWDGLAVASVEVGLLLTTFALISGPIWAKPAWGVWWVWDARTTSTFVLWVLYVCWLILRRLVDSAEQRAILSAVYGIFAFLDVPLVYFSIWWWRTQHPPPVVWRTDALAPPMRLVYWGCVLTFGALAWLLIRQRYKMEAVRHELSELQVEVEHRIHQGARG